MRQNKKGMSLIIVIFAMMLFAILGWTLVILQSGNFETVMRQAESEKAFYLAEAGIQHGLSKLGDDSTWRTTTTGDETYTLGNGQYILHSADGTGGQIEVTSTGYIPSTANGFRAKRVVRVVVTIGSWEQAISAITMFDWYRMHSGSYINGDITAGGFEGDGDAVLNELGADYDHPPTAKPPSTSYKRDLGGVSMPDIDMAYYKTEAQGVSEYIGAPYVFVTDYSTGGTTPGLVVLNNTPAAPTLKGSAPNFNYSYAVHGYFTDSNKWYTCVASGTNGFKIIEVTNPANPALTKTVTTTNAYGVFTDVGEGYAANYAYVADGASGMRVIDISSPGSASVAATRALSGTSRNVYLRDTYAFVTAGSLNAAGESGKLYVVSVSSPTSPTLTATVNTAGYGGGGVYVRGQYAFVACGTDGTKGILQIYNVSNPASPSLRATVNLPNGSCAYDVYVKGRYAFVAAGAYGLQIVDIAGLSYSYFTPSIVASYRPDTYEAKAVHVSGTYAYIAYGTPGLRIVNVSDPSAPTLSGTYDTNDASGVFVLGDKVFDANHNNDKVWYTVGTSIIKGGKYNHTSMVAEGDIEIISAGGIAFKAHVTTSANENFPNLASRDGSIISSNETSDSYDGLIYSKNGIIDFNGISSQGVLMAYNIFLDGDTGVAYSSKYVGTPPSGFVSGVSVLTWKEM